MLVSSVKETLTQFFRDFSLKKQILIFLSFLCAKCSFDRGKDFFDRKIERLAFVKDNVLIRYLAKELFVYFLVCFAFFFIVFFCNQILLMAEKILQQRVPVKFVIRLIIYTLPTIISQSAPFATLVGFLMCLGRMVTDNEVMIIRASGQNYSLILIPVLIMGLLISLFSFVMNDYFLPLGTIRYNRLLKQIVASNPAVELEPHSIKRLGDSILVIGDVEKTNVSDLAFFDLSSPSEPRVIICKDADIVKSKSEGVLMELNMKDSTVIMLNKGRRKDYDVLTSEDMKMNIFEDVLELSTNGPTPREMTSHDLKKKIDNMAKMENYSKKQMNQYKLEYNKKFSLPFGSIFFAILAFPLALVFGRKDGQTLGLIFGIIISVMYWAASILGQMFGLRGGYDGFWMMWGPNFFIGIAGLLLYLKLKRK